MSANQVLERARAVNDRGPKSIYVSKKLWDKFEKNVVELL